MKPGLKHSLAVLGRASTSRVLNLCHIATANRDNAEYTQRPLFNSNALNTAFILKQRLRHNEDYQFASGRSHVTKIIVPFDSCGLSADGRSIVVGHKGFCDAIRALGNYSATTPDRDVMILRLIDDLPSLDPFLMREHLFNHKIDVAPCYFAISERDQDAMHAFTTRELKRLTGLLGPKEKGDSAERLVVALLSSDVAEELTPLRATLNLAGEPFRNSVFSWRGFLYYKWSLSMLWPNLIAVVREIQTTQPTIVTSAEPTLPSKKNKLVQMVRDSSRDVVKALSVYDSSFSDLVARQHPKSFRDFLLAAPHMFLDLGEKMGALSHVAGFWRHRFPLEERRLVDSDELAMIFDDFMSCFVGSTQQTQSIIKQPPLIDATHKLL